MLGNVGWSRIHWRPVVSGIPQYLILAPALFSLFISALSKGIEWTLSKFVEYTELGGVTDTPKG